MSLPLTPSTPTNIGTVSAESASALNPTAVAEFWAYPSSPGAYPGILYPSQAGSVIADGTVRTPGAVGTSVLSPGVQSLLAASQGVLTAPGASQGSLGTASPETPGTLTLTPR